MTDITLLSENDTTLRDCAIWRPYAVFLDVDINSDGSIDYAYTNDPLGIIPKYHPYPTSGLNLGKVQPPVNLDPGAKLVKGLNVAAQSVGKAENVTLTYDRLIDFNVYSSRRRAVRDLVLDPGARNSTRKSGGGQPIPGVNDNLLICLANDGSFPPGALFPEQFMMILNYNIIIEPPKESFNSGLNLVHFTAHSFNNFDSTGVLPQGSWTEYDIWVDGSEMDFTDPANPVPIDPNASNKAYPAINMSGML